MEHFQKLKHQAISKTLNTSMIGYLQKLVMTTPSIIRCSTFTQLLNGSTIVFSEWLVNANGIKFLVVNGNLAKRTECLKRMEYSLNFRKHDINKIDDINSFCKHLFIKFPNFSLVYNSGRRKPDINFDKRYYIRFDFHSSRSLLLFHDEVGVAIPHINHEVT